MNYQISSIRAIACILVVIVHVSVLFINQNGYFESTIIKYFNQIARLGTPIFCIITGFLFSKYYFNQIDIKKFYKSRIKKILIPYLIWTFIFTAITLCMWPDFQKKFTENLINPLIITSYNLILGSSFYHLYFISIIIQFCIIFPLICKIKISIEKLLLISFLISILSIKFLSDKNIFLLSDKSILIYWIFYFIFGIYFYKLKDIKISKLKIYTILILTIFLVFLEIYFSTNTFSSLRIENLLLAPLFFFTLYKTIKNKENIILSKIGLYSMGIYFIHPLIILLIKNYIFYFNYSQDLLFLLISIIVLFSCIFIAKVISKTPFSQYIITLPSNKK